MERENAVQQIDKIVYSSSVSEEEKFEKIERIISQARETDTIREEYISILIDTIAGGLHDYEDLRKIRSRIHFKKIEEQVSKSKRPNQLFIAFIDFVNEKNAAAIKHIDQWFSGFHDQIQYLDFIGLIHLFKQGYHGMWNSIGKIISKYNAICGLERLCYSLELFYHSKSREEVIDSFSEVVSENGEIFCAREFLGFTYYSMQMWKNAIAYFEQSLDKDLDSRVFEDDEIFFYLAWSYGKVKEYTKEEECYRKLIAIDPEAPFALNNLGYCLFKQKKYFEAKAIFDQCINEEKDLRYSVNNMLRVLIACGDNDEAVRFSKKYKDSISKELLRRVGQTRIVKAKEEIAFDDREDEEQLVQEPTSIDANKKGQQFSSEKVLEDELTHRIEKGHDVFGVSLSVYEQKGVYGRQFIMPVGRVDILANDAEGNLYAIELKKDSGYCDVYDQVNRYVKWLEGNMVQPKKKVYGIIVMNDPSEELKMRVRTDPKIKLYEYSISYREIE